MRYAWAVLRVSYYLVCGAIGSAVLVGLVAADWWLAMPTARTNPLRLQWYVTVKNNVAKGTVLLAGNLRLGLRKQPTDDGLIRTRRFCTTVDLAVGKYATEDIAPGAALCDENLAILGPGESPVGGAIVPVVVKTDYTGNLKPGMRLAFVGSNEILPALKKAPEPAVQGFLLVSIAPSPREPSNSILSVAVPKDGLVGAGRSLATGDWRPILLDPASSSARR
jgi:hypothetical protein